MKYGITTKQMLITLEKQLMYFLWINLNVNDMSFSFNKTVKNIITNYFPYETVTFNNRDCPWIKKKRAKYLILEENEIYKRYVRKQRQQNI